LLAAVLWCSAARALTLSVEGTDGNTAIGPYRWLVEEDSSLVVKPGVPDPFSIGVNIAPSHAYVVAAGDSTDLSPITALDSSKRYIISILPDSGYSLGATTVPAGAGSATVLVNKHPIPLAQMRILVFEDTRAISAVPELPAERGLPNFNVIISEIFGHQAFDAFGNSLGTTYQQGACSNDGTIACAADSDCTASATCDANAFVFDGDGAPVVATAGELLVTDGNGIVVVKNLQPGDYSVTATPRDGGNWIQSSSLGGGPGFPVTVRAGEPDLFVQGGLLNMHAFLGFVKPFRTLPTGTGTITGRCVTQRPSHPPLAETFPGPPLSNCYVGINRVEAGVEVAVLAQAANPDGTFTINSVPVGSHQVVLWDRELDHLMTIRTVEMVPGDTVALGDVTMARWFSTLQGVVWRDENGNGFIDSGEDRLPQQALDIRDPDGSLLQFAETDSTGSYVFPRVPGEGVWTIAEVNFDAQNAISGNFQADHGGPVGPNGVSNPNEERVEGGAFILLEGLVSHAGQVNIANWGKAPYGPGPDGMFDTPDDENGGIPGIVVYNTTRAENDPRLGAGEDWEPGIPNVQIEGYKDFDVDGFIDDNDGISNTGDAVNDGLGSSIPDHVTLADVDNWPLGWADGGTKGPEDIDWNYPGQTVGVFDSGDAVQIVWSDSFDDNLPTDCVSSCSTSANIPCQADSDCPAAETCFVGTVEAQVCSGSPIACTANSDCPAAETCSALADVPVHPCAETLRNWNQLQPEVFDGGFAVDAWCPASCVGGTNADAVCGDDSDCDSGDCAPGWTADCEAEGIPSGFTWILHMADTPGIETWKEEDRNVDFGDQFVPTPDLLPPVCVGPLRTVPQYMTMDRVNNVDAPFAGDERPLCNFKQTTLGSGQNADLNFMVHTFVPRSAQIVGTIQNLLAAQQNEDNPNFGGFDTPAWLPVSIRDYLGNEHYRTHADEYGRWSQRVASTWSVQVPEPSGVSPGVWQACINTPSTDPFYNSRFDQPCFNVPVLPGKTKHVLTNVTAIAALSSSLGQLDCALPDVTPVVDEVNGVAGGPYLPGCAMGDTLTITSPGTIMVPDWTSTTGGLVSRDAGFSGTTGSVTVGGIALGISSWSNVSITATVPASVCAALATGGQQLLVTRGDNAQTSWVGITVHSDALGAATTVTSTIQAAIDAASPDGLILIPPGTYAENLIMPYPVRLQGYGAYSTIIDASNFAANQAAWENKLQNLIDAGDVDLLPGQREDFAQEKGAGITVLGKADDMDPAAFTSTSLARLDGLTVRGAAQGGGIFLNGNTPYLQISNNVLATNQGFFGGGIRVGWLNLVNDTRTGYIGSNNHDVTIHHNHFNQNGSFGDGGGVVFYNGADGYAVTDNYMCGNYSALNGAAVSVFGLSPDGLVARNYMILNEAFGEGGAVAAVGEFAPPGAPAGFLSEGVGSMVIDSNLMQSNLSGDDGGGISLFTVNGQDVAANPADPTEWYSFLISNNKIVNNVGVFSAGGIALADATNVHIINNTIANNDCTAGAVLQQGNATQTTPQGAGIVARPNGPDLAALTGEPFVMPLLENNIIWHNRTFFWDAAANGGLGDLVPDPVSPYWDLQVFAQGPSAAMDPRHGILTDTADPRVPVVYDASNTSMAPAFMSEFLNTLTVAPNIISPVLEPRTLTGDYHITAGSPAVDMGSNSVLGMFDGALTVDCDGEPRPTGAAADAGADEVQQEAGVCSIGGTPCNPSPCGGTCLDVFGPIVRNLIATPNPTMGATMVMITATADDSNTGGSTIMEAEYWIGTDPGLGSGTGMSGAFASSTEPISATVTVPGAGNFNVFVRAKDSAGNWGVATAVFVTKTGAGGGDTLAPVTTNLVATPNPTNGAGTVTITAIAHDTFTGGSDIAEAEWFIDIDPGIGNGFAMSAADGFFDSTEENITAMVTNTQPTDYTIFVRSRDSAGNWESTASVLVDVTPAGSGSGRGVFVQCPGDDDGDALIDSADDPNLGIGTGPYSYPSNARCMHISGGDGFAKMADGRRLYMFGFNDLTGTPADQAVSNGLLAANWPAPTIMVDEGDEFYLSLTNVSMAGRPDLFDPHSVHWHGFPNAAAVFDGLPDASIAIGMGSTFTYYYLAKVPGTYMWHCHVEATEHMQMGMLGSLYMRPAQNRLPNNYCFATQSVEPSGMCAGHQHSNPDWNANRNLDNPLIGDTYAYNDGDGSTRYDVEYPIQIGGFDPEFHDASEGVQPLPFALMKDTYPMLNGRGYPDTINPNPISNLADDPKFSQKVHTKIEATQGDVILLRISDLNVTEHYTLGTLGIPMHVIGMDARLLRGPGGADLSYTTNSVTLGGGQSVDVLLDTTNVALGTYPIYTTNLHFLSNNEEDFGGMMSEITISAP
jgi:FtsP/CotA-like multicopper oxidase with cupredoxin domain